MAIYKPKSNVIFEFAEHEFERIEPTIGNPFLAEVSWNGTIVDENPAYNNEYSGYITYETEPISIDVTPPFALCGYIVNEQNTSGDDWLLYFMTFRYTGSSSLFKPAMTQDFIEKTYSVGGVQYEWNVSAEFSHAPYTGSYGQQVGMRDTSQYKFQLDVNFPVFDTLQNAVNYIAYGSTIGMLNGSQKYGENTVDYYIYNRYQHATYKNGSPTWDGDSHGAYERILATEGSLCLYRYAEPNVYMIKTSGSVVGSYFHHNSRPAVENADPADFSNGTLLYASPFYDKYRNELGDTSGNFALFGGIGIGSGNTNIPMFKSLEDAEDYLSGEKSIEDAENYDYLINGFGENPVNPTGTEESLTENGLNMSRGVFAVDYCMSRSGLASLGGDFFSETYLEDMKRGLELYGNNPMNSVLQCLYLPFDASQIFSTVGVNYVAFGSYQHPVSGYGISKILFNTGLKDLGSTFIRPTYGNFLDYTATEIFCFLPYVGWVNLDVNKYMNTTLSIKYAIDIHSGECTAMLYSNGRLMDCYDGQCGIKQPITSEDMSSYFMAQIEGMKSAMGAVTGGALQGAQIGAKGGAYGAIAGGAVGATLGGINAGTTLYGLSKMRPQLFSSGGYSGALGANLPQYPMLVFCFHDTEEPANLLQTHGKPSNKSGSIGSFTGFLSVNSCNLKCGTATNNEKDKIMAYLASGIII